MGTDRIEQYAFADFQEALAQAFATMTEHRIVPVQGPPVPLLGYGQVPEAAVRPGVHEIAEAIRAARAGFG